VGKPDGFDSGIFPEFNESLPIRSRINQYLVALYIYGMAIGISTTVFTRNEQHWTIMCLFDHLCHLFEFLIYLSPSYQICVQFGINSKFRYFCFDIISEANLCPNMAAFLKSAFASVFLPLDRLTTPLL